MRKLIIILLLTALHPAFAQDVVYSIKTDIHYYTDSINKTDKYINERCILDLYYPTKQKNFATVVWFHGGGLTGGSKEIPKALTEQGIAVIGVNYRLSPKVKSPAFIQDAAAAVAWAFKNIANYGGDPKLIFVAGHSAGGYLTAMIGLDKQWLKADGIDANDIAGLIPLSCQAITHFTIREERGIPDKQPVIDKMAPLFHVRGDAPPLLLITGDREMEMLGRYEENAYLARMMKIAGHKYTTLYEIQGYGHDMTAPGLPLLLNEVRKIVAEKNKKGSPSGQ
ncbi:MAG: lipase [Flavobacterium sp. BFFFF1]|uniref:alpha/beta hydrolase n=1 Tax=Flavobacterium sp. BFFFF1 TaxID=2015557 RepID=UPI000BD0FEEA|nr:alpha/beta hydrolase [Flavobacterium sp. BFFFF1]OYU79388.1 MAG: lipase [Flavobacterium sp. BFFFF1]